MDGDTTTTTSHAPATALDAKPASWLDLEPHVYEARSAARVLHFLLTEALDSQHPLQKSGEGYQSLWLGEDIVDALNYTVTKILVATRQTAEAFEQVVAARSSTG
jgi:hypothetical protein